MGVEREKRVKKSITERLSSLEAMSLEAAGAVVTFSDGSKAKMSAMEVFLSSVEGACGKAQAIAGIEWQGDTVQNGLLSQFAEVIAIGNIYIKNTESKG